LISCCVRCSWGVKQLVEVSLPPPSPAVFLVLGSLSSSLKYPFHLHLLLCSLFLED
jgi:hypothetical protein